MTTEEARALAQHLAIRGSADDCDSYTAGLVREAAAALRSLAEERDAARVAEEAVRELLRVHASERDAAVRKLDKLREACVETYASEQDGEETRRCRLCDNVLYQEGRGPHHPTCPLAGEGKP